MRKLVYFCLFCLLVLTSCGSKETTEPKFSTNIEGKISTIYYAQLEKVLIKYEDNLIGESDSEGAFNLQVELASDDFSLSRLSFECEGYVFNCRVEHSGMNFYRLKVKANVEGCKESWADNFYKIGGKVVYHYDGETPLVGAKLFVDGNLVKIIEADGNFDLEDVIKGSVISVSFDGYKFVDITNNPFSSVTIESDVFGLTFRGVESNA